MAGKLWLAGSNSFGMLGDNTIVGKSSPVETVIADTDWQYIGKNIASTISAIRKDGTLWLWGINNNAQIGDNTSINKSSPVQTITGGTSWEICCSGFSHSAAIKTDGTLWLWGSNGYGQLGNDSLIGVSSPIQTITFGTNWADVAAGFHTAAVKKDGTLWVWGRNNYGQLGIDNTTNISSPVQTITGGTSWSIIASGYEHTAAIKTDGTLWLWGRNTAGQLGDNTNTNKSSPVQTVAGGTDWYAVACGGSSIYDGFTVAVKNDGTLWTWGKNSYGQLGDTSVSHRSSPVQTVAGGSTWISVAGGTFHTVALKSDNTLWTWGRGSFGQLANNSSIDRSSPVQTALSSALWQSVGAAGLNMLGIEAIVFLQSTTASAQCYNNINFGVQPVISFVDGSNNVDTSITSSVTVSVTSGNATLSGTTTVAAVSGVATFTDLKLVGYGLVTLSFASGALTPVTQTVNLEIPAAVMPKRSETASSIPTSGQLRVGELAINLADQKGYVKKTDGTIVNVFTGLSSGVISSYMISSGAIIPDGGTF